jgi:cystathionine beta-lyase/cystathionine gamma-synthase
MASYHGLTSSDRARRGISDGLVRLSCGLEDPEDLWRDIEQALDGSSSS